MPHSPKSAYIRTKIYKNVRTSPPSSGNLYSNPLIHYGLSVHFFDWIFRIPLILKLEKDIDEDEKHKDYDKKMVNI